MTLLVDAGPLVALADRRDPLRPAVRKVLEAENDALVIAAPVTAEVDYLLGRRIGQQARLAFLEDLAAGRFIVECLEADEYAGVAKLERSYLELDLGLAACATVLLAARLRTRRILTFDERHFRVLRPLQGGAFELLPQR
ncbi:MAG: PIN domain-containing protein [Actinobacteria bacterium]|nr:PIN domain-containing protein [Actinomycetota bacterium]